MEDNGQNTGVFDVDVLEQLRVIKITFNVYIG